MRRWPALQKSRRRSGAAELNSMAKSEVSKGKWLDVAVVASVLLALFVGLVVFHRCFELGRSLSNDYYAMIGATLLAAVLGFGAIWHPTRSSYRTADEERKQQRRAVAAAILFEIDAAYQRFLKPLRDAVASIDPGGVDIEHLSLGSREENPFVVLNGNTSKIGD